MCKLLGAALCRHDLITVHLVEARTFDRGLLLTYSTNLCIYYAFEFILVITVYFSFDFQQDETPSSGCG